MNKTINIHLISINKFSDISLKKTLIITVNKVGM